MVTILVLLEMPLIVMRHEIDLLNRYRLLAAVNAMTEQFLYSRTTKYHHRVEKIRLVNFL